MRVAVLGTGIMGFPIARNLAGAGIEVSAWNRTAERAEPLREHGVDVQADAEAAIGGADLVITILSNAEAVEEVMGGEGLEACGEDTVWAQLSTVGIDANERLVELAADAGVRLRRRAGPRDQAAGRAGGAGRA